MLTILSRPRKDRRDRNRRSYVKVAALPRARKYRGAYIQYSMHTSKLYVVVYARYKDIGYESATLHVYTYVYEPFILILAPLTPSLQRH